jgi:hypothetical protein
VKAHLYPARPYDQFTTASDDYLHAIYAILMSCESAIASRPLYARPFPSSVRSLIAGWKLLFSRTGGVQTSLDAHCRVQSWGLPGRWARALRHLLGENNRFGELKLERAVTSRPFAIPVLRNHLWPACFHQVPPEFRRFARSRSDHRSLPSTNAIWCSPIGNETASRWEIYGRHERARL